MPSITREIVQKAAKITQIHSNNAIFLDRIEHRDGKTVYIDGSTILSFMGRDSNTKAFAFYSGAISHISKHSITNSDIQWVLDTYKAISGRKNAKRYFLMGEHEAKRQLSALVKHSTLCNEVTTDEKERADKEMRTFFGTIGILLSLGSFTLVSFLLLALVLIGGLCWGSFIVFIELMQGL
jgi:hypothetical protein